MKILIFKTKLGYFHVEHDEQFIWASTIKQKGKETIKLSEFEELIIRQTNLQINNQVDNHNIPLKPQGTSFQRFVYKELINVLPGEKVTYKALGQRINSKAYQAIGTSLAKNKILYYIPCHRVVSSTGIGNYQLGTDMKIKLLLEERAIKKEDINN